MNRWIYQAQSAVRAIGLPGVVAAGVLAFCAMFWFTATAPARSELDSLERQVVRSETRTGSTQGAVPHARSTAQQLKSFLDSLPDLSNARSETLRLHASAQEHGLQLESGEYRLLRDETPTIARYQLRLQVRGSYVAIRGFLAEVLESLPAIGLDEFLLTRENIGADEVTARLQFSLFMARTR